MARIIWLIEVCATKLVWMHHTRAKRLAQQNKQNPKILVNDFRRKFLLVLSQYLPHRSVYTHRVRPVCLYIYICLPMGEYAVFLEPEDVFCGMCGACGKLEYLNFQTALGCTRRRGRFACGLDAICSLILMKNMIILLF